VKTDDRATRQRDEVEGDEAKVVRLSDWLGPDDELVPFGPRALAHGATHEPAARTADPDSAAEPPGASGFWDGDTSVHTAVPGPEIFDDPDERTADRRRSSRWRPAWPRFRPAGRGSHLCERLVELVDRISWKWATAAMAMVALVVVALVAMLGGSSGHRETTAQAGIAGQPRLTLSATLADTGTATRAAAVRALRRLPSVDAAVRKIGVATKGAQSLQARHRPHVVVAPTSVPSSATTGSVETTTTASAPAPAETTSAPSETEPVQTTSDPTPTTGAGGSASGGGPSSGSQQQSAFGAGGSLGPGSSPNG
jgi:hypothetical protein